MWPPSIRWRNYALTFTMELASDWSITGEWCPSFILATRMVSGSLASGFEGGGGVGKARAFQQKTPSHDHYSAGGRGSASGAFRSRRDLRHQGHRRE